MSRLLTEDERRKKFETKWTEWKLIEFNGTKGACKVQHKCGNIKDYETYFNIEKRGPTCQECVDTKKWYWDIGDTVGDLMIINRRALPNTLQEYQYKCNICGFDCSNPVYHKGIYLNEYWVTGHSIIWLQKNGGRGCACCSGKVVQPGINDVATTEPTVVDYFVNRADGNKWTKSSLNKVQVKCLVCGSVYPKLVAIQNLTYQGFNCINCGSGISFPEKFVYFLLQSLKIKFEMHKTFEWSRSVYDQYDGQYHKREYDFYIPDKNIIIEAHGEQHYRDRGWPYSNNNNGSFAYRADIDVLKQELALKNGYNYVILDCSESYKEYIKNSILSSELNNIFDLSNINWEEISRQAISGIARLVVQEKENNPTISTTDLVEKYGMSLDCIIKWLKNANLYDVNAEYNNRGLRRSYPVYSPELNKAFRSIKHANKEIGIGTRTIYGAVNHTGGLKHAGRHPVTGERLTWERWTLEQYEEWLKTNQSTTQN